MKYEKEFRQDHPETVGETDKEFDKSNYMEWLEKKVALIASKREQAVSGIVCPFCNEDNFDQTGLKYHIQRGYCATFNNIKT